VSLHRARITVRGALLGLALLMDGCAAAKNTPQQDYVWAQIDACRGELPPQCQVTAVGTDGNIATLCTGTRANMDNFNGCVQDQYKKQPYADWLKAHPQ